MLPGLHPTDHRIIALNLNLLRYLPHWVPSKMAKLNQEHWLMAGTML